MAEGKAPAVAGTNHALVPFLQRQNQSSLSRLYSKPSACLAVFRLLSPVQRQLVMNILWLENPVAATTMNSWVTRDGRQLYQAAIFELCKMHIVPAQSNIGTAIPAKLGLNSTFKASLRLAIVGGGDHRTFGAPAPQTPNLPPVTLHMLDAYATERWETILHFMVSSGTDQSPSRPSPGVLHLLQKSGLMVTTISMTSGTAMKITSRGFQFLLNSPHAQLWELLLHYLGLVDQRNMDLVEVLSFLFMLSTMELGQEYTGENLTQTQLMMLDDLRDYGLAYQRPGTGTTLRFFPTRLATTLTSSLAELPRTVGAAGGTNASGFIILETNYRLYAYTDNPLQIAVLNLFVTFKSRFPNLVVGMVTRDSVKKALANGISAEQIIAYLSAHAHPQMHKNNPLLPVTVQDQIRLWELERNRVKADEGFLWTEFTSQADYDLVRDYASKLNLVIWENPQKRMFFASTDGHANIRTFIERRRQAMGGNM
ncbi:transcription factor Tfb2 [Exidia glandulosa HHB12029]|uniref:RNA polymerase II transcription factor B subunit 2 n=1 Tax=Exidia glandulosa HHB12029 TaxID=1314781 RepID=A0A165CD03_EXIGL|nr:transcription factor Tfb2 [Exidia glandulosa HHB12029]